MTQIVTLLVLLSSVASWASSVGENVGLRAPCTQGGEPEPWVLVGGGPRTPREGNAELLFELSVDGAPTNIIAVKSTSGVIADSAVRHMRVSRFRRPCSATDTSKFLVHLVFSQEGLKYSELRNALNSQDIDPDVRNYAQMPNKKMQLTIAKAARLATPSLTSFAIAADL